MYIRYATDGVVLREAMSDRDLSKYGTIILDEVRCVWWWEGRWVNTNIILKALKKKRNKKYDSSSCISFRYFIYLKSRSPYFAQYICIQKSTNNNNNNNNNNIGT
jgi:hypothetical protein